VKRSDLLISIIVLTIITLFNGCALAETTTEQQNKSETPSVLEENDSSDQTETATVGAPASTRPNVPTIIPNQQPESEIIQDSINGNLFIADPTGVIRLSLPDETQERLLEPYNNWIDWKSRFSESGQFLAYWIRKETTSELWITPLNNWSPDLIISFDTGKYDVVRLEWLANDKYILLRLGNVVEDSMIGQREDITDAYLINLENKRVDSPSNWSGDCTILAISPKSKQIATWCFEKQSNRKTNRYVVVEDRGEVWFTENPPTEVLKEIAFAGDNRWAWSLDRQFVAFTIFDEDEGVEHLFYRHSNDDFSTTLTDNSSELFSFLVWSPDNQFITYSGDCPDGYFCQVIMKIDNQNVVWNSQMSGLDNVRNLSWSPDSQHVAVSIPNEVVIVNIMTNEPVFRFQDLSAIQMVWIEG